MIDDAIVIDAVCHAFNLEPSNHAAGRYSEAVSDILARVRMAQPPGYRIPPERSLRDTTVDEMANLAFLESGTDFGVFHVLPLNAYKDGLVSLEKAVEVKKRWPQRFVVYAGVDPLQKEKALDEFERQVELLDPIGLKLYPNSWGPGPDEVRAWRMDDPEVAFPLFERARKLGVRQIAIHKALPLGVVPFDDYRVGDIDRAAFAFPDLNFEIIHAGIAFGEETAWLLGRYPNVYGNLESTASWAVLAPGRFERAMATLMSVGGADTINQIIWGTGMMSHPQPAIEAFWRKFQFSAETMHAFNVPQLDAEAKRKILAGNYARMAGLDLRSISEGIKNDSFARRKREEGPFTPYSTTNAGTPS